MSACVLDPITYGCPVRGARRPRRACRRVVPMSPTGGAADPLLYHPQWTAGRGIKGPCSAPPSLHIHTHRKHLLTGECVLSIPLICWGSTWGPGPPGVLERVLGGSLTFNKQRCTVSVNSDSGSSVRDIQTFQTDQHWKLWTGRGIKIKISAPFRWHWYT